MGQRWLSGTDTHVGSMLDDCKSTIVKLAYFGNLCVVEGAFAFNKSIRVGAWGWSNAGTVFSGGCLKDPCCLGVISVMELLLKSVFHFKLQGKVIINKI